MRPCTAGAGNKDRSTDKTTSDLAYGESYAAGMGLDPNTFVDVRVGAILIGVCAGICFVLWGELIRGHPQVLNWHLCVIEFPSPSMSSFLRNLETESVGSRIRGGVFE